MEILTPEFIHEDERRKLSQLFTDRIEQVNSYDAVRGAILGNHYHKETREYFLITKGTVVLYLKNSLGVIVKHTINKGTNFVVYPYETHTLVVMSHKASMLTLLSKPYQSGDRPDIWPEKLL